MHVGELIGFRNACAAVKFKTCKNSMACAGQLKSTLIKTPVPGRNIYLSSFVIFLYLL